VRTGESFINELQIGVMKVTIASAVSLNEKVNALVSTLFKKAPHCFGRWCRPIFIELYDFS
jgi:hypothetical protein